MSLQSFCLNRRELHFYIACTYYFRMDASTRSRTLIPRWLPWLCTALSWAQRISVPAGCAPWHRRLSAAPCRFSPVGGAASVLPMAAIRCNEMGKGRGSLGQTLHHTNKRLLPLSPTSLFVSHLVTALCIGKTWNILYHRVRRLVFNCSILEKRNLQNKIWYKWLNTQNIAPYRGSKYRTSRRSRK